ITTTGVYAWSATVTITLTGGGTIQATGSGYVPVVAQDGSPYGAGWGIDGIPQLYPVPAGNGIPAGVLKVEGSGDFRFYIGAGPYTSAEDPGGIIVANQGGTFTYTAADQT